MRTNFVLTREIIQDDGRNSAASMSLNTLGEFGSGIVQLRMQVLELASRHMELKWLHSAPVSDDHGNLRGARARAMSNWKGSWM